jgi:ribosomal protein S18 acetylase RimI-like enzyme
MAHYRLQDDTTAAEVDFTVHPDFSGCGIAVSMLRHIAEKGRERGIKTIFSYIATGNDRAFHVFQRLDCVVESSVADGVYEIRVRLDQPAAEGRVSEGQKGAGE